jgi:hypothetical protein
VRERGREQKAKAMDEQGEEEDETGHQIKQNFKF